MGILKTIRKIKDPVSHGEKRSPKWEAVRKEFLEKNPTCAVTGFSAKDKGVALEIHHKKPFHLHPELELDPNNLITLARKCPWGNIHIMYGHLGSFKSFNPNIEEDATYIKKMLSHKKDILPLLYQIINLF